MKKDQCVMCVCMYKYMYIMQTPGLHTIALLCMLHKVTDKNIFIFSYLITVSIENFLCAVTKADGPYTMQVLIKIYVHDLHVVSFVFIFI